MICKNCQKEIGDDSRFCEFCGTKLDKNVLSHDTRGRNSWHWRLRNALLVLVPFAWFVFAFLEDDLDEFPELLWFMLLSDLIIYLVYESVVYVIYGVPKKS